MKKLAALILLGLVWVHWSVPAAAQMRANGAPESRESRKAEKKQQKAQKKYAKSQQKAEKKMLKTERKGTKYPSRQL
jgi:hypothetical protein